MNFEQPLLRGKFVKRYKRFFVDIELPSGEVLVAHCPNTGSMKTCMGEGFEALILPVNDPKRKLKFTLEATLTPEAAAVGVNTHRTNAVALEALRNKAIPALAEYAHVKPEVKYGSQNSRIDALLTGEGLPNCYVEVKNTTLMEEEGIATFPDAITTRGTKHLQELMEMVGEGHRAVMLYVVNRTDCQTFKVAEHIDPTYAKTLREAMVTGVEVMAWGTDISEESITLAREIAVEI